MFGPVSSKYIEHINHGNLQEDAEQLKCILALDVLYKQLHRPFWMQYLKKTTHGVYIVGEVGRGKTYLMDLFFSVVKKSKQRWHYHLFLSHLHHQLMHYSDNPWENLAKSIYKKGKLLCLDEFQILDMGDLMILNRFLKEFFNLGGTLVTTSNRLPNEFTLHNRNYLDQFHNFIKTKLGIVRLDHGPDFRRRGYPSSYFSQNDPLKPNVINLDSSQVYQSNFKTLFESAKGVGHYVDILNKHNALVVTKVKQMNDDNEDSFMRFVQLVDLLYETKTQLSMETQIPIEDLYAGTKHQVLFKRTLSRLIEITSR